MKTYKTFGSVRLLLLLSLFIFAAPYGYMPAAAESDQLKECYSQCVNLYSEYMAAVKNNLDAASIDARFQSYKSALDKYKDLLSKNPVSGELKKISDLPEAGVNAFNDPSIQERINSGGVQVSQPLPGAVNTQIVSGGAAAYSAKTDGVVMASVLNVRSGPWGDVIGQLNAGAKIEIISKQGSWYKVLYNGRQAYLHSGYIATKEGVAAAYEGYVTSAGLNVRSGPFGSILGVLSQGSAVEVLEKKGDWLVVKYNGREAFVHSDYISKSRSAAAAVSEVKGTAAVSPALNTGVNTAALTAKGFDSGASMIGGPVPPARITSTFGPRDLFGKNFHYGVDIGVPTGTPLRSIGEGKVISTGYDYGGGKTIVIKYDNGTTSSYAHCRDASVSVGDSVKKGTVVGHSNNTGAHTTGPHLHFSLKNAENKYIDPLKIPSVWY